MDMTHTWAVYEHCAWQIWTDRLGHREVLGTGATFEEAIRMAAMHYSGVPLIVNLSKIVTPP